MTDGFRKRPLGLPEPEEYDFQMVHQPLAKIYYKTVEVLKTESLEPPTLYFIKNLLFESYQTYRVISKLVSETEKEKFTVQAHMLSRFPIDATFVAMALLDDPSNTQKYELSGYREQVEKYEEEQEEYHNDPQAELYLKEKGEFIEHLSQFLNVPPEMKTNPKSIQYWPTPPQMLKNNSAVKLSDQRKKFLENIYKWHYKQPSNLNHFSWEGMAMSIFASLPQHHWSPGKYESDAVYFAQLFLLIILSEIDIEKNYGNSADLRYLWTFLGEYYKEVQAYYLMRYKDQLH